ncbi:LEA type 2 family protein [Iodobacter arcticus]|uniref:LEA type 2 family protein n=1 Tax=Iodobacter arcticus TaxID=590593 RepID=A0ABW2QYW6_9NEIS
MFKRLHSGLLLLALLTGCASFPSQFEKPTVSLAGLSVAEIGLLEQRFVLNLRVTNPNDISVVINGVQLSLDVNGKPFADGVSSDAVTLPKLGSVVVKLNVTTSLNTFIQQFNALQASGKPIAYRIKGKLFLPLRPDGVSFERQGEVNLP